MKRKAEITAEQILIGKQRAAHPHTLPDGAIQTISAAEVVAAFRRRFEAGPDVGIWKRLSNIVLEPVNPFSVKSSRRIRQEAIILGTLTVAAIALATYFNLNAPRGDLLFFQFFHI